MYFIPYAKAQLKLWAQNYGVKIGTVGARINEPADAIAKQQANMQQLTGDIDNVTQARLDLQRLTAVMDETVKRVGAETRDYVRRLKTNSLLTEADVQDLQIECTRPIQDVNGYKPVISGKQTGALIHLSFQKHGADSMNVYGRLHGEADFKWLGNAKHSPFIYTPPATTVGITLVFEFYLMPTLANTEVGLRSDIMAFKYAG